MQEEKKVLSTELQELSDDELENVGGGRDFIVFKEVFTFIQTIFNLGGGGGGGAGGSSGGD
jgi:hypothetical protein